MKTCEKLTVEQPIAIREEFTSFPYECQQTISNIHYPYHVINYSQCRDSTDFSL